MEITDFLEGILNKEEHAGDLLKKDKTYISLGNGNNNILIEYNGLNSYNFKVYRRFCVTGTWKDWVCELDSGNFKSYVTPSSIGAINKPTQKSLTIPNTGWVDEVHGSYLKKLVLAVDGITESMIVNLNIALESDEVAVNCGFASINKSGNGTLTFYAESVPSASINATYYVLN